MHASVVFFGILAGFVASTYALPNQAAYWLAREKRVSFQRISERRLVNAEVER